MKKLCVIVLLALFASFGSSPLAAQTDGSGGPISNDESLKDELVARVDAFMKAWEKQDATALRATLAPDFLYVTSRGAAPREGVVGALTHACTLTSYSLSDVRIVPISTNSAALVYKIHQTASCAGHPDPPVVQNTDTLVRREGKWLFLLTTSTPAE
jgi:hypothetical protein